MGVGGELEKVKVTPKTAEVIENSLKKYPKHQIVSNYDSIGFRYREEMDLDTLIRALYIGYEVEATYEVGDWVKDTSTDAVFQIKDMQHRNNIMDKRYTTKRPATPEEIQQEKERRWWAKRGRGINEYKKGDVVSTGSITRPINYLFENGELGLEGMDYGYKPDELILVCLVENRLDTNE